ncbi:hypothetical protein A2U01_0110426, partial [Trifolium medium]|nr:hypothetical protein [Trifolium medium]
MEAAMWEDVNRIAAAVTNFTTFTFAAITTLTESRACDAVTMLWCLWKRRNEK